jgi:hypothetical protein
MFPALRTGQAAVMSELMDEPEGLEDDPEENEMTVSQEGKGYGEDEGEREESLPPE